jgi:peptide deformylase
MPLRPLVLLPNPLLKTVSVPVAQIDDEVRRLATDMLETMYDALGIGLAAIQIGIARRMIVLDVSREEDKREPRVLINPEIVWQSEERRVYEEGCLSIPDYSEDVERPDMVRVRYLTLDGQVEELEADGLLSTCLQHEIDHLNGILFIDHLSRLKRDRVMTKFTKAARRKGTA